MEGVLIIVATVIAGIVGYGIKCIITDHNLKTIREELDVIERRMAQLAGSQRQRGVREDVAREETAC